MKRIEAWRLRELVRAHGDTPARARHCGVTRYSRTPTLETNGDGAWWQGVIQCRARVCPTCFVSRRFKNAREIDFVVRERELETRKQSYLATFTVRHSRADHTSITRDVRSAWRDMLQSRAWRTFRKHHSLEWVVAEEITHGENGWHPHLHALFMPVVHIDERDTLSLASRMHEWWARSVRRKLGEQHVPSREHGADLTPCDSADYLTKIGLELTDPAIVKGRTPLDLLAHGQLERYLELQLHRQRARDITFSRGLGPLRASMPPAEPPAVLATITGSQWHVMRTDGWEVPLAVADASFDHATGSHTPEAAEKAIALAMAGKMRKPKD